MKMPGAITEAGRVLYMYNRDYMGGTLFCELPSGRLLTYAKLRHEEVDILDDDDEVIGREVQLRFSRGFGRAKLWRGLAAENIVQATAADVLRGTLLRLEADPSLKWMPVRLHTHDEILVECDEARAPGAALVLRREMQRGFDWSDGLPINSDETIARFYTKATGSIGL
jgi:DNA polymerase I-like protein with 3'-5' exonuclease and polymerase domains